MLTSQCCLFVEGQVIPEEVCDADPDGDGVDAVCGDECPNDPLKTEPGICGCDVSDNDSDFDTVPDCVDRCPGKDDRVDSNHNNNPDCLEPILFIPAVSEWGMVVLLLLLLIAIKLTFEKRMQCN